MQTLKELVTIAANFRINKVELIGNTKNAKTKFDQLFKGINEGIINSDNEAINLLYKPGENKSTFLKLKNRFKQRLLNTILFVDTSNPAFTPANKTFYEGNKILTIINILMARGARKSSAELAEKWIKKAIKYEYTELAYHFAKTLVVYYSTFEKNEKTFRYYSKLAEDSFKKYSAEQLVDSYYYEIGYYFTNSRANQPQKILNQLEKYLKIIEGIEENCHTIQFRLSHYSLQYYYWDLQNDMKQTIKVCKKALEDFTQSERRNKNWITAFARRLFSCQIKLGEYADAMNTAQKYLHVAEKGTINWFKFQISYFMLQLYQENFEQAMKVYLEVAKHEQLRFQDEDTRESWKIFGVYVYFFSKSGKITPNEVLEEMLRKFRLTTFLNDVPKFGKDKRGMNVMILIAQVLVLLLNKKYNDIIDRIDALYRYTSRHLAKDDSFRSNCFIKMLLKLPEADFERSKVERKAAVLLKKLQSVPLDIAPQNKELEVVPYERLWLYILELLEDRPQRLRAVLPSSRR